MKRQIRCSVFETNSSSTHSICISREPISLSDINGKVVSFTHGEFGWEFNHYDDVWSKASYLYQAICELYPEVEERSEILNQLYETLSKYGVSCDFEPPKKDRWGCEEGYIDHGSETYEFVQAVLHSENRLLRYLFGNSIILTGNDNSDNDEFDGEDVSESNYEIYFKGN